MQTSYARLLPTLPPVPKKSELDIIQNQFHTAIRRWQAFKNMGTK
jgi:hypothetical protein